MLQQYEEQIDRLASEPAEPSSESNPPAKNTVILTGSTGKITRNLKRGLCTTLDPDRVTLLKSDLTQPSYGLDNQTFQTLLVETTQIIHSAWPVDFNQPLSFFQPSLRALVNLVAFARQAEQNPALLFLSSISAVGSATGLIPEDILPGLTSPAHMGYGQSKYLAERILAHAASALPHLHLGVARISQVSGQAQGPEGAWARTEWLPSLVVSSRHLGALPDSLGGGRMEAVGWVPVDELAVILVELSKAPRMGTGALSVFHRVNPVIVAWQDLGPAIVVELSTPENKIGTISFEEWLTRLQSSAAELDQDGVKVDEAFMQNPAVRSLEFYRRLLIDGGDQGTYGRFAIDKTVRESQALAGLRPIQSEWMRRWISEWIDN